MNDRTIAFRAKEPLGNFLGKVFAHFSRPRQKSLADMLYGIQASGDTQLSSVMRAINDDSGKCHVVEKRLSRNVADETVGDEIDKAILEAGAKFVGDDTPILVDPTEIRKEFGLKMEHVTTIRDASRRASFSALGKGAFQVPGKRPWGNPFGVAAAFLEPRKARKPAPRDTEGIGKAGRRSLE